MPSTAGKTSRTPVASKINLLSKVCPVSVCETNLPRLPFDVDDVVTIERDVGVRRELGARDLEQFGRRNALAREKPVHLLRRRVARLTRPKNQGLAPRAAEHEAGAQSGSAVTYDHAIENLGHKASERFPPSRVSSRNRGTGMFDGFELATIALPEATLRVRYGGGGPPVLLLHGHPRTHTTWHRVAPLLAARHTVVCPDLRGFGRSSKAEDTPDHAGSSKRAKARDCVDLMHHLGFERFAIVGHDRGAYTAFRCALDYPSAVTQLAVLDAVPILDALERCDARFATEWWHWFFFAQPDKPERAILADPDAWYRNSPERMGAENYADYREAIHDPQTVHGMIEDYRAGLGIDRADDAESRSAGLTVLCPTLVLWALRDDLERLYGNVLAIWKPWTRELSGRGLDCGHHMAEEAPALLARELESFLGDCSL